MRASLIVLALSAVMLTACGTTREKTVVVNPPADSTTVVHSNGDTSVTTPH